MGLLGRLLLTKWAVVWAISWTVIIGPIYMVGALFDRTGVWLDFVQRIYCRLMLLAVWGRLRVEGELDPSLLRGGAVLMGNHRSYLDIPAVVLTLRALSVRFVAKRELTRIPFLGWALFLSHHIKVDRGDREQAIAALQKAVGRISHGVALAVFPEGTRSPDRRLLPFKKGGFYIAVDSGFPILPISIRNSERMMSKTALLPRTGTITVVIHPPIPTGDLTRGDIPALMRRTRSVILSGLPESRALETDAIQGEGRVG